MPIPEVSSNTGLMICKVFFSFTNYVTTQNWTGSQQFMQVHSFHAHSEKICMHNTEAAKTHGMWWWHSHWSSWRLILHRTWRCMSWVHAPTTRQATMRHPSTSSPTMWYRLAECWTWQACHSSTSRPTKRRTRHTNLRTRERAWHCLHLRGIGSTHWRLGHTPHRRCNWVSRRGKTRLVHWR